MPNQLKRLTIVDKVYHQIPGEDPTHISIGFTRYLQHDEQPFSRSPRNPAPKEWVPLDMGWILDTCDSVSLVVIQNLSRLLDPTILTEDDGCLHFRFADSNSEQYFIVPPGEGYKFVPSEPSKLLIRSTNGEVRYSLTVFPG